ncbi:hypothetical protein AALP_AA7G097400 [Arabis alpina]|uniref:Uncharacterized protein n=1 Tax=Arabis alpina TaxID=50452 RepID=A0A087GH10_ARAAL|nr:hypothetical protein AALP_AA7G097400 [Arabis alpina]
METSKGFEVLINRVKTSRKYLETHHKEKLRSIHGFSYFNRQALPISVARLRWSENYMLGNEFYVGASLELNVT